MYIIYIRLVAYRLFLLIAISLIFQIILSRNIWLGIFAMLTVSLSDDGYCGNM